LWGVADSVWGGLRRSKGWAEKCRAKVMGKIKKWLSRRLGTGTGGLRGGSRGHPWWEDRSGTNRRSLRPPGNSTFATSSAIATIPDTDPRRLK
jgi:hypothetical protein